MKSIYLLGFLVVLFLGACSADKQVTQEQDEQVLRELLTEIEQMASSVSCEDDTEWKFTAIGSKACGGNLGYIAYSQKIDEKVFLEKVAIFTQKQQEYNIKWSIVSDCSIPAKPTSVVCIKGKPEFRYGNNNVFE